MEKALELRILSGLQAGARLRLTQGQYSLGKAELCDIIIAGRGVESLAAELELSGDKLYLIPVQSDCGLSLDEQCSEAVELEVSQPFRLGDLWLAVDAENAAWPEPDSWLLLSLDDDEAEEEYDDDEDDSAEDEDDYSPETPNPRATPSAAPKTVVEASSPASPRRVVAYTALACTLIFIFGTLSVFVLKPESAISSTSLLDYSNISVKPAVRAASSRLDSVIADMGYTDRLMVHAGDDGPPTITGFLPSEQELALLKARLQEAKFQAVVRVNTDDMLKTRLEAFLRERKQPWTVRAVRNGTVIVAGADLTPEQAQSLAAEMRLAVGPIRAVENGEKEAREAYLALQRMLQMEKFSGTVTPLLDGVTLRLEGKPDSADLSKIEKLLLRFNRQYGSSVELVANFPSPTNHLPFRIRQIVAGPLPYVITDTDTRVYEGGEYLGFRLVSVRDRKLVFSGAHRVELEW
jgi:type III secretion system YscD/HrpQ family protein